MGGLLDDYVSLGILADPAAAAGKKAAAATARSQRPELLQRVPWMPALKGIRSPLLRLHQGGWWMAGGQGRAGWSGAKLAVGNCTVVAGSGGVCARRSQRLQTVPAAARPSRFPPSLLPPPFFPGAEMVEFCRYLAPSPAEAAARQAAIDRWGLGARAAQPRLSRRLQRLGWRRLRQVAELWHGRGGWLRAGSFPLVSKLV